MDEIVVRGDAPQGVQEEEAKLYRVHSTVDGWKHRHWFYDGIQITWLGRREAEDRYQPPWVEEPVVDVGIGGKDLYLASAVDELFTCEEAEAFVAYLKERYGGDKHLVNPDIVRRIRLEDWLEDFKREGVAIEPEPCSPGPARDRPTEGAQGSK